MQEIHSFCDLQEDAQTLKVFPELRQTPLTHPVLQVLLPAQLHLNVQVDLRCERGPRGRTGGAGGQAQRGGPWRYGRRRSRWCTTLRFGARLWKARRWHRCTSAEVTVIVLVFTAWVLEDNVEWGRSAVAMSNCAGRAELKGVRGIRDLQDSVWVGLTVTLWNHTVRPHAHHTHLIPDTHTRVVTGRTHARGVHWRRSDHRNLDWERLHVVRRAQQPVSSAEEKINNRILKLMPLLTDLLR